jgi:hypothetical protein
LLLYSENGKYFPSFFNIRADTDNNIDTILRSETLNMVIHEYIHYVQDVSTIYGLANMSNNFSDIAHFYNIPEKKIKLPYVIKNSYSRQTNADLFSVYFNNCDEFRFPKYAAEISISKTPVSEIGMNGFDSLFYYEVKMKRDEYIKNFEFGACAIMEGMAILIERYLYPEEENTFYHIPYDLPEIIVTEKYPILLNNKGFIAALCDVSLMFYHPAEIFVRSLEMMVDENFSPTKIIDIYRFVVDHIGFDGNSYNNIWYTTLVQAIKDIENVVNVDEYAFAKTWAIDNILYYNKKRKNNHSFLTKIFEMDKNNALSYIYSLITGTISPLIYNNKFEFCTLGNISVNKTDREKLYYWFYLGKMFNYVFTKGDICPYNDFCKGFCKDKTKPYKNIKKMELGYCVFQQFSRVFGLYKREIEE